MVRFTLFCRKTGSNLRVEFPEKDRMDEVGSAVREATGFDEFILRNGYSLLPMSVNVGECISEDDTVEVLPDPESYFR